MVSCQVPLRVMEALKITRPGGPTTQLFVVNQKGDVVTR